MSFIADIFRSLFSVLPPPTPTAETRMASGNEGPQVQRFAPGVTVTDGKLQAIQLGGSLAASGITATRARDLAEQLGEPEGDPAPQIPRPLTARIPRSDFPKPLNVGVIDRFTRPMQSPFVEISGSGLPKALKIKAQNLEPFLRNGWLIPVRDVTRALKIKSGTRYGLQAQFIIAAGPNRGKFGWIDVDRPDPSAGQKLKNIAEETGKFILDVAVSVGTSYLTAGLESGSLAQVQSQAAAQGDTFDEDFSEFGEPGQETGSGLSNPQGDGSDGGDGGDSGFFDQEAAGQSAVDEATNTLDRFGI